MLIIIVHFSTILELVLHAIKVMLYKTEFVFFPLKLDQQTLAANDGTGTIKSAWSVQTDGFLVLMLSADQSITHVRHMMLLDVLLATKATT